MPAFDKNIQRMKVAITTKCNLNCAFCYVDHTGEMMDFATARRSVDLLIRSPGVDKILSIYGGEPVLNLSLLTKMIPYAVEKAKSFRKNLTVSCCSNGLKMPRIFLRLLRRYNMTLHLSLVGDRRCHDEFRNIQRQGSYDLIMKNLPLIKETIPARNLGACFCVFPSQVNSIEDNFHHIVETGGFRFIQFEIIKDYQAWTVPRISRFVHAFAKISDHVMNRIAREDYLYLGNVCWELKYGYLTLKGRSPAGLAHCPFRHYLEVHPSGDMAFAAFLLHRSDRKRYVIGNVNSSRKNRFFSCHFNAASGECRRCLNDYFSGRIVDKGDRLISRYFDRLSWNLARLIQKRALTEKTFRNYIAYAKERVS